MIRTVADFLEKLAQQEAAKLDTFEIRHAPTIGAMYEGLSKSVLSRAVPTGLNLQVVSGFASDGRGNKSGQIDCMLVRGRGEVIPYTGDYVWHIKDILAVLEIKKNLYGSELSDAFDHLREVKYLESSYLQSLVDDGATVDTVLAECAFEHVTGVAFPPREKIGELDATNQLIYHTLLIEQLSAVRIILGYHGFRTEHGFRRSLVGRLVQKASESPSGAPGFGVGSFPQLIISGQYSLCKANGQPFMTRLNEGMWPFYFSSNAHPLELLLEFIWTRLVHACEVGAPWGDDLTTPALHPLLSAEAAEVGGRRGWMYKYHNIAADSLASSPTRVDFEPTHLSLQQAIVITVIGNGIRAYMDDSFIAQLAAESGFTVSQFIDSLVGTGLVAIDVKELQLTTQQCIVVALPPNKQFVAGEDVSGRVSRWVKQYMDRLGDSSNQQGG